MKQATLPQPARPQVTLTDAYYDWLEGASERASWGVRLSEGGDHTFPGGSRERVTRAGDAVRVGKATMDDLIVINVWRAAHRHIINSFQAILRNRTRRTNIVVAQRHKRQRTIFDKLSRLPGMNLGRMDDVAGCRVIFGDIAEMREFRANLHSARFKHRRKNADDKYDYIARPKPTGYRGIHDVYEYDANSEAGRPYKGLYVELQYRTTYQHAWATANELIGSFTESQPKFGRGDPRYERIMRLASEIIARAFEDMTSSLPDLTDDEVVREFLALDAELHLMQMLRGLNVADEAVTQSKNVILILGDRDADLEILEFPDATSALRALFDLEQSAPEKDVVLVRGDSPTDVREAFKNYFSDAKHFVNLVDEGCQQLLPEELVVVNAFDDETLAP